MGEQGRPPPFPTFLVPVIFHYGQYTYIDSLPSLQSIPFEIQRGMQAANILNKWFFRPGQILGRQYK